MRFPSTNQLMITCNWLMAGAGVVFTVYVLVPIFAGSPGPIKQVFGSVPQSQNSAVLESPVSRSNPTMAAEHPDRSSASVSTVASSPAPEPPATGVPDPRQDNTAIVHANPVPIPLLNPNAIPKGLGPGF